MYTTCIQATYISCKRGITDSVCMSEVECMSNDNGTIQHSVLVSLHCDFSTSLTVFLFSLIFIFHNY